MESIISKLRKLNVRLTLERNKLKVNAPKGVMTNELLDLIKYNKQHLIEYLLRAESINGFHAIKKVSQKEHYLLSPSQKRLYFLYEFDKTSLAYNMPQVVILDGDLDVAHLERAFQFLVKRHESLRTWFELRDGEPVQMISEGSDFVLERFQSDEKQTYRIVNEFIRPFDLNKASLIRIGLSELSPRQHLLIVDMHHIITDGVSQGLLIKEFMAFYNGMDLEPVVFQYKDYAEWIQSEAMQEAISRQKEFWQKEFAEDIPVLELPTDFSRPLEKRYEGHSIGFELSVDGTRKLKAIAKKEGSTMFMVLLSAYAILLSKVSGQEDIVIGTPTAGRQHDELEKIIGMFVNMLPLRIHPKGEFTFKEFLSEVKSKVLDSLNNQGYPYEEMITALKVERSASHNPLFDVVFSYHNFEQNDLSIPGLNLKPADNEHCVSKFDLTLTACEKNDRLSLNFEYSTGLFRKESIDRFAVFLKKILSGLTLNVNIRISEIEILTDVEKDRLLNVFNETDAYYPKEETIVTLFEKQANKTPNNIALRCGDKILSYQEINENSERIASYLKNEKRVTCGDLVGVMLEREEYLITSILGILKTGAAYIPIDPHYPLQRISNIIQDSGIKVLITRGKYLNNSLNETVDIVDLSHVSDEISAYPITREKVDLNSSDLAYVIYTSGSSGKPKGVMIEHHSVINRIHWMQKNYPLHEKDIILQKTPVVFDVSVWELFWWSFTGASLCILMPGYEKEPQRIAEAIEKNKITTLHFVPSMLSAFLSDLQDDFDYSKFQSLRLVFASGEALKTAHVQLFGKTINEKIGTRLINLYGPTEATIDVSYYECNFDRVSGIVPIGKPIDNIRLYVLDKNGKVVPMGVRGELCIGGAGLARGYLKNEKLTDERFVINPIKGRNKIYRTGDLARWLQDGNIEFLGRFDDQVKIRGFRIELGEIESHLSNYEGIQESAVIVREKEGEKYLAAYFSSEKHIDISAIRNYLSMKVPEYMVPSYYLELKKIPLTSNGKVDKKTLPDIEFKIGDKYVAPASEIEERLLEIWSVVLKLEKNVISTASNFFEAGGDSISIIKLTKMLNAAFKCDISVANTFRFPTIASIADFILKGDQGNSVRASQMDEALSEANDNLNLLQNIFNK